MGGSPTGRKPSTKLRVKGKRSSALTTAIFDPISWSNVLQPVSPMELLLPWFKQSLLKMEPAV